MRKHPRSFLRATGALVACGFVVAASAQVSATTEPPDTGPTDAPTTTDAPATTGAPSTVAPTTVAPTTVPAVVERQPLTGVPIDGTLVTYTPRPALIVKIDNVEAQPQAGLNQADIVFEEIVEGATRFAAVFNSTDSDPVGPIRSGRTQDIELFSSFNDPVFAYSGGNDGVNAALNATGWTLLTQGNGMFRDNTYHGAPHNLFGNTSEFFTLASESANAVPQFEYVAPGTQPAGTPVSTIDVSIGGYSVNWAWDAAQGLFLRSQNGSTHDTNTGQASANTVIVLSVPYGQSPAGGVPEAQTTGTGSVVVYTAGHKIEGTWIRNDASEPFSLTDASGAPILLSPGRTWVELADAASSTFTDA